ncbi:hypothetical protein [Roseimaritima sediminicola]|nr:hypothetical protein [Roseimaritima sediminicola]
MSIVSQVSTPVRAEEPFGRTPRLLACDENRGLAPNAIYFHHRLRLKR